MSSARRAARRKTVMWLAGAAVVAAILAMLAMQPPQPPPVRAEAGELVLPAFAEHAKDVRLVMVTTAEESYHLALDSDGWVLPEKGRHPVRADRIADLIAALSTMTYAQPMTRDEKKFDRIGLGDPGAGGAGATVEIGNGRGDGFATLIIGYRDGRSYVRLPNDLQAWAVDTKDMPPLQRGAAWLDLDIAKIAPGDIAEVLVRPVGGLAYGLVPADATGQRFEIAPPFNGRPMVAAFAASPPALAMTRFLPIDVTAATAVQEGRPMGEHTTRMKSGWEISTRLWRTATGGWAVIVASAGPAASQEAKKAAETANAKARGWAFRLTDNDFETMLTPLGAMVGE